MGVRLPLEKKVIGNPCFNLNDFVPKYASINDQLCQQIIDLSNNDVFELFTKRHLFGLDQIQKHFLTKD